MHSSTLLPPPNLLSLSPSPPCRSLWECGGGIIADGRLLDLIRRVYTFGMSLLKLDLRQESTRHADALDAVTTYLGYGSYKAWDEDTKLDFLTRELTTKRPLIPLNMPMSDEVSRRGLTAKGGSGRGDVGGVERLGGAGAKVLQQHTYTLWVCR